MSKLHTEGIKIGTPKESTFSQRWDFLLALEIYGDFPICARRMEGVSYDWTQAAQALYEKQRNERHLCTAACGSVVLQRFEK